MATRVPNRVELARKPDVPRYIWVAKVKEGDTLMGMTWAHLDNILNEKEVEQITFVDLFITKSYLLKNNFEAFMANWRLHYFDANWQYKQPKS